jgi:hypothetical protein
MRAPRFRLRTLVVLIAVAALVLGLLVVSRENARLRAELRSAQQAPRVLPVVVDSISYGDSDVLIGRVKSTAGARNQLGIIQVPQPQLPADTLPNGQDAFARSPGDK